MVWQTRERKWSERSRGKVNEESKVKKWREESLWKN